MGIKSFIKRQLGGEITEASPRAGMADFSDNDWTIYERVKEFTMTSPERIYALIQSVEHLTNNSIEGDLVECGVWKGGSTMAALNRLQQLNDINRNVWLFDTFEGMSEPTEVDVDPQGRNAAERMATSDKETSNIWAYSGIDEVKKNITSVKYPLDKIKFIKGKVEDTLVLAENVPDKIALLRLDTDWYESTKIELEVLYDKVVPGGVIIIDDYGHWQGCKKAVDEFIKNRNLPIFLHRIDYTGRMFIKP